MKVLSLWDWRPINRTETVKAGERAFYWVIWTDCDEERRLPPLYLLRVRLSVYLMKDCSRAQKYGSERNCFFYPIANVIGTIKLRGVTFFNHFQFKNSAIFQTFQTKCTKSIRFWSWGIHELPWTILILVSKTGDKDKLIIRWKSDCCWSDCERIFGIWCKYTLPS